MSCDALATCRISLPELRQRDSDYRQGVSERRQRDPAGRNSIPECRQEDPGRRDEDSARRISREPRRPKQPELGHHDPTRQQRTNDVTGLGEFVRSARDVLQGVHRDTLRKLNDWAFNVDDTPRVKKPAPASVPAK